MSLFDKLEGFGKMYRKSSLIRYSPAGDVLTSGS